MTREHFVCSTTKSMLLFVANKIKTWDGSYVRSFFLGKKFDWSNWTRYNKCGGNDSNHCSENEKSGIEFKINLMMRLISIIRGSIGHIYSKHISV